jgi:hypothetical protein
MRFVASAIVCFCALYAVDSMCFNGWYFGELNQMVSSISSLSW